MKTLYVYADFDWLDEPMLVGELGYESLRGSDSYSFKYDNDWLRGEYDAAVGYEHLIADFPDVESVKNDEKRHGDIVSGLLDL